MVTYRIDPIIVTCQRVGATNDSSPQALIVPELPTLAMSLEPQNRSPPRVALAALIVGAIAIGSSPILIRLSELQPTATAFWRVALATPIFFLVSRWGDASEGTQGVSVRSANWRELAGPIIAGVFLAVDLICLHWSVRFTTVVNSILFLNLAPLFVAMLAWLLYREQVSTGFLVGMAISIVGMAALVGKNELPGSHALLGDVLGVGAGAFYGGYLFAVAQCRQRLSTASIMAWSAGSCAVVLLMATLLVQETLLCKTLDGVLVLVGLAVITHAGGQGLIAYALKLLPASSSSATLMIQPIVATFGAWTWFGETISPWQIAGAIFILIGILACRAAVPTAPTPAAQQP